MNHANTRPPGDETGYQHAKCYARSLADCSREITREHYISESVLLDFGGVFLATSNQFGWKDKALRPASLTSKILCKRHNEALSPLDAAGLTFFRSLKRGLLHGAGARRARGRKIVSGIDVERWILKAFAGYTVLDGDEVPTTWQRILFGYANLEKPSGLRLNLNVGSRTGPAHVIEFTTCRDDTGARVACGLRIQGWRFVLSVDGRGRVLDTNEPIGEELYRLNEIGFDCARPKRKFILEFKWPEWAR